MLLKETGCFSSPLFLMDANILEGPRQPSHGMGEGKDRSSQGPRTDAESRPAAAPAQGAAEGEGGSVFWCLGEDGPGDLPIHNFLARES